MKPLPSKPVSQVVGIAAATSGSDPAPRRADPDGETPSDDGGRAPYTIHDTASVRRRIDQDLAEIVKHLRAADPALRSVILTGGFARGEGAVLDGVPLNDYDLLAIRGSSWRRPDYPAMRARLSQRLGIEVDLAPVAAARLPWVRPTLFWYETALRGRILWGRDDLRRIRVRTEARLDPNEGCRLLANRAAGLLFATGHPEPGWRRIQSCKALLAALDVHLLAGGRYAPSHRERWEKFTMWRDREGCPPSLVAFEAWLPWAYRQKLDPARATIPGGDAAAWQAARAAILSSLPVALRHAGLASLDAYARRDRLVERALFVHRSRRVPGAKRWCRHPTGRLRVATLRLLEASSNGTIAPDVADALFARLMAPTGRPLETLDALRGVTLA